VKAGDLFILSARRSGELHPLTRTLFRRKSGRIIHPKRSADVDLTLRRTSKWPRRVPKRVS